MPTSDRFTKRQKQTYEHHLLACRLSPLLYFHASRLALWEGPGMWRQDSDDSVIDWKGIYNMCKTASLLFQHMFCWQSCFPYNGSSPYECRGNPHSIDFHGPFTPELHERLKCINTCGSPHDVPSKKHAPTGSISLYITGTVQKKLSCKKEAFTKINRLSSSICASN